MGAEAPTLILPKLRRYAVENGVFYLSKGVVSLYGPLCGIRRWSADRVLNRVLSQYGGQEGPLQPETLYQSWSAAEQDPEAKAILFTRPSKLLLHFIIPPDVPTETAEYVLADANGTVLPNSPRFRVFNQTKRFTEHEREIVFGESWELPFDLLDDCYYNGLEDLDPETGFLKKVRSQGRYPVQVANTRRLNASIIDIDGSVHCYWDPSCDSDQISVRGATKIFKPESKILLPESLIE